jgi:hypothetical protein
LGPEFWRFWLALCLWACGKAAHHGRECGGTKLLTSWLVSSKERERKTSSPYLLWGHTWNDLKVPPPSISTKLMTQPLTRGPLGKFGSRQLYSPYISVRGVSECLCIPLHISQKKSNEIGYHINILKCKVFVIIYVDSRKNTWKTQNQCIIKIKQRKTKHYLDN